ncbi:hypothetical protein M5D96_008377 [Drosophila gunungcola]|uniref:GST N-terminal domain-containing protein n=1 Tax=Drosophila gunungcola TaxID=103775 RepID=A0A9Q0BNZ5_9MUSC|nr:hypothetical protein M5D96_008377 [Drosophila gunungcola]
MEHEIRPLFMPAEYVDKPEMVLKDDQELIYDSPAIIGYLVNKYAQSDELYPKDPLQRAVVDQRLHFETGVLFHGIYKRLQRALFRDNATEVPKDLLAELRDAYGMLEDFWRRIPIWPVHG